MKKILVFFLVFLCIIGTYYGLNYKKINYVSLSDSVMNNSFNYYSYNDYLKEYLIVHEKLGSYSIDFTNHSIYLMYKDIHNNRTIKIDKEYYLKKVLRESDIVVISLGVEELSHSYHKYNMESNYVLFNKLYINILQLIKEIKKYAQSNIVFLGYYNPTNYYDGKVDEFFYYMDDKLNRLMVDNGIAYISLYELVKGNNYKNASNRALLNTDAHQRIASILKFYFK